MTAFSFSIEPYGENGWIATLSKGDMVGRALAANAAADTLRERPGVTDAVAGVESIVLRFRPSEVAAEAAKTMLSDALQNAKAHSARSEAVIEIPVCYGGEHGPDFEALCEKLRISGEELISLHSGKTYRVLTVGFAPGFAYLGPLPETLQTQRLATPRAHVPAGSVGVAGAMTGVYALASPGGWPLIGRTPKCLFEAEADEPFLFSPGATVRFTPIDQNIFAAMEAEQT